MFIILSRSQAISQNQGRTPSGSNISGLATTSSNNPPTNLPTIIGTTPDSLFKFEHIHMRTAVPIGTVLRLQETPNPVNILVFLTSHIYLFRLFH